MKSCDNWGHTSRPQTARPGCECLMCVTARWDTTETSKRKPEDRPG